MLLTLRRLAVVVGILAFSSSAAAADTVGPAPLDVYAILSTTGGAAFIGNIEVRALRVLEAEINASGGINGRPMHFNVLDDQTNPQLDVQFANELAAKDVPLFLGPNIPAGCFATGPIIEKTGPLSLCLNPFGHPPPGSYQFAPFPDSYQVAAGVVRFFRLRGITRIAMINATDGSGSDSDLAFGAAFKLPENRTMALVAQEHYGAGDVSVTAQLARIKAAKPQAIISYNTGAPFGTVLRGLFDAGIDLPVATSGGNANDRQIEQYAGFLPAELDFGALISFVPGDAGDRQVRDKQMKMIDTLKKAGMRPEAGFSSIWDAAELAVDVLRHLPPNGGRASALAYLSKLQRWIGIDGIYDFVRYPQRGVGIDSVLIVRWDVASKTLVPASRGGGAKL
jgi:branched-chain amino acid transport system substrate-binding protein